MLKRKKKSLLDQATEAFEGFVPVVEQTLDSAVSSTKDALADGRVLASHALADTRAYAADALADGREYAAEKVAEAKGEQPAAKKGRKVRRFLLFGVLLAVGGAIFKKVNSSSSSTPAPAPRPVPTPPQAPKAPAVQDTPVEEVAASPDESIADAAAVPVADTTPDDPAEVVELDDAPQEPRP